MSAFSSYPLAQGCLHDLRDDDFPTVLHGWIGDPLSVAEGTHFGFVQHGPAELRHGSGTFVLGDGMYFAAPGQTEIRGGRGMVVSRLGYQGLFHVGGPVESRGRLRYIDGCTDSLLIAPVLRGDPCLNLLYLPPGTRQSPHTHPSIRVGCIIRGRGFCVTADERIPLSPGLTFVIRSGGLHCFQTDASELLVLAYHPDSDFGPTHEEHPMINRTILSAHRLSGMALAAGVMSVDSTDNSLAASAVPLARAAK